MLKRTILSLIAGFTGGLAGAYLFIQVAGDKLEFKLDDSQLVKSNSVSYKEHSPSKLTDGNHEVSAKKVTRELPSDFAFASKKSTPSVVYIKTISEDRYARSFFELFFDELSTRQSVSSGSGVIYTEDGFIITNNHVIDDADMIQVIHNKVEYDAKVVGTDPSTDLAVLKIESNDLPKIEIGNSRDLAVGEWVLAVGNPFNLTSTVTAGIVSAKGREINILKSQFPIESFIQTDAAINPGNSGGALVDIDGKLVGINTAILSRTGSYAGYGFAVPVDIVRKIVDDLIKYGEVQKAFIGAEVIDLDPEIGERLNLDDLSGVVLSYIQKDGAAEKAGLEKGDVIVSINNESINSRAEWEEQLSYFSPGESIELVYRRQGKEKSTRITLVNREGTTDIIKKEIITSKVLGADFEVVSKIEKDMLGIGNGLRVVKVKDGFIKKLQIEEGFIITHINKIKIENPEQLSDILSRVRGRVIIEGINKRGMKDYYTYLF